ncbi:DUF748 domain-containing protein [Hydrogenimonas cancrithermarum]|uniref:DUF748 domain-containing protein n=1 Tax=Hydrogenimonas cancrithermarum TaxID=2993563 RepID=A0ABM8FN39_9BACT|nr:DUF748 domain-containing protein [Hydrogenimonas cancrithermarum]BDY13821.1 hypothetical protein HCR_21330 [Hydrogenimonas cancrithermarum]
MKIYRKKFWYCCLAFLFFFYTIAGFWMLPFIASKNLPPLLSKTLGTDVTIGAISFNPYTMQLELSDITIEDKNERDFFTLKALDIDFSPISSLFNRSIGFDALRFKRPAIHIVIEEDGSFNFSNILKHLEKKQTPSDTKSLSDTSSLPPLRIRQFAIESATLTFEDLSKAEPVKIVATNYNFGIENISTLPNEYGFLVYEIETKDTAFVRSFSKISLNPFYVRGELDIQSANLKKINHYLKESTTLDLREGRGDLSLTYNIEQTHPGIRAKITKGRLAIHNFRLDDAVSTPATIDLFEIRNIDAEWPERSVSIDEVILDNAKLYTAVDKQGSFSFNTWKKRAQPVKRKIPTSTEPITAAMSPWKIGIKEVRIDNLHTRLEGPLYFVDADHTHSFEALHFETNGTVQVLLEHLNLHNIEITEKEGENTPLRIKRVELKRGLLRLPQKKLAIEEINIDRPDIRLVLFKNGQSNIQKLFLSKQKNSSKRKSVKPDHTKPFGVTLKNLDLQDGVFRFEERRVKDPLRLTAQKVGFHLVGFAFPQKERSSFRLSLKTPSEGTISAEGSLLLSPLKADFTLQTSDVAITPYVPYVQKFLNIDIPEGSLNSHAEISYNTSLQPKATIDYSLDLKHLKIDHALTGSEIFSVERITVKPAHLELGPNAMKIDKVVLEEPYIRVHVAKDKSTNLDRLVKRGPAKDKNIKMATTKKRESLNYSLTKVEIKKGRSDFSDLSLPLPFATHIQDLKGEAIGISSLPDNLASIQLKGIVDRYGMANIKAFLIAADPIRKSEIDIDFRNLDVTNLSPYTGKYIGYTIKDGRLWLKLKYTIEDGKLLSENKIVLKKLELGDKIESDESIEAPIQLAIALLKDSNGIIDLDIPLEGNVTDPKFKVGKVVWQAIGNMISGIVTAPFRFLGNMLGIKGEELQYVDFEPGSDTIDPTEREKLDKLVEIFKKRPLLKLELTGSYHIDADSSGIRRRKLKDILTASSGRQGSEKIKNEVTIHLLERVFVDRAGIQALDKVKKTYVEGLKENKEKPDSGKYFDTLYAALLKSVPVTTEELRRLADNRAENIASYLEKRGIERMRTAIHQPKALQTVAQTGMIPLKLELGGLSK